MTHLYGSSISDDSRVWVRPHDRGWVFTPWWQHVGGVVLLDYDRKLSNFSYGCTVLVNPLATRPLAPEWFSRARVCFLDGHVFRWCNGEPGGDGCTSLPDGTVLEAA